ncbi:MAG TPA: hypothetical protein VLA79_02490 [Polyangia bacterium]|nr:hypothetical protein [Polyangia bacterium]
MRNEPRPANVDLHRCQRLARTGGAALVALAISACGNSGASSTSGAGGAGLAGGGHGGSGPGAAGSGGAVAGTGGSGATGTGAGGATGGLTGTDAAVPVVGDGGGVLSCTPGVEELIITNCGYPATTSNPLTSTVFNENEVFRAIRPAGAWPNGVVQMFYNDEHAMTLGVREVAVKSSSGTTTTDYPITPLATDPGSSTSPQTGTNMLVGDQSGLDPSLRPMWPSLFISDISVDPNNRSGDWQQGGAPTAPNAIFGSWKAAVRTVDNTKTPSVVTITPDADPAKNNWMLAGGDTPPSGLANEGYGAEARWNVQLVAGHSYRLQVLVHDGDQNKGGGDSGEACVLFCAGADSCTGSECSSTGTGGSGGTPQCPSGTTACSSGGVDPATCPSGSVCANGCCLPYIPLG